MVYILCRGPCEPAVGCATSRILSRDLGPGRTLSAHGAEYHCRGQFGHQEEIEYRLNIDLRGGVMLAN